MKSVTTQKPDKNDLISEIVDSVEPLTVAQTQLTLLMETLEKIQMEGGLTHLNLTKEDIEFIKQEMRKMLESRQKKTDNKYMTHRVIYSGGAAVTPAVGLNIGMKDPSLHYVNDSTFPSVSPKRPKTNLGPGMITKFWKKVKKHKH